MSAACTHPDPVPLAMDGTAVCPHCLEPLCEDCEWVEIWAWGQVTRSMLVRGPSCERHRP